MLMRPDSRIKTSDARTGRREKCETKYASAWILGAFCLDHSTANPVYGRARLVYLCFRLGKSQSLQRLFKISWKIPRLALQRQYKETRPVWTNKSPELTHLQT